MNERFSSWASPRTELDKASKRLLTAASFLLPILLWCLVSYSPYIWHPQMEITSPGQVSYFREGSSSIKSLKSSVTRFWKR
ncbi:hypothetical protein THIOSC15_2640011 [uncultured Thiomicrorhabdus sp.]